MSIPKQTLTEDILKQETEFKTLMYNNIYVNTVMLSKGIYPASIPTLWDKNVTLKDLAATATNYNEMTGSEYFTQSYFENLSKCELVPVRLQSKLLSR